MYASVPIFMKTVDAYFVRSCKVARLILAKRNSSSHYIET